MRHTRGQSTFELTLTVVVVIAAVIAMSIFMKRSVMGKLRDTGNQVGGQFTPLGTSNAYTRTINSSRTEKVTATGVTNVNNIVETRDRTGTENVVTGLEGETLF